MTLNLLHALSQDALASSSGRPSTRTKRIPGKELAQNPNLKAIPINLTDARRENGGVNKGTTRNPTS